MYEIELRTLVALGTGINSVHWMVAPDNSNYPLVMLNHVSSTLNYSQDGMDNVNKSLIQIDIYTKSFTASTIAKNSLIAAMNGYSGPLIHGVFINNIRSNVDTTTEDKLFRYSVDVYVWN